MIKKYWKDILPGALASGILFMVGKFAISLYIGKANVGSTYGAAGSLVVLLVWVYYSAIILYLGAEFAKTWAINKGSSILPNDYAVAFKKVDVESDKKMIAWRRIKIFNFLIKFFICPETSLFYFLFSLSNFYLRKKIQSPT